MLYDAHLKLGAGVLAGLGILYLYSAGTTSPNPPDDSLYRQSVIERPGLVLVKFGADWCGPCRAMEPELDRLNAERGDEVRIVRIDVDQHPQLAEHYHVSSIPRLILFRDGKIVGDRIGGMDSEALKRWVSGE